MMAMLSLGKDRKQLELSCIFSMNAKLLKKNMTLSLKKKMKTTSDL